MTARKLAMVTVQVRDFDVQVAWYRDVLGLTVDWFEPDEFCALALPDGDAVLAHRLVRVRDPEGNVIGLTTETTPQCVGAQLTLSAM